MIDEAKYGTPWRSDELDAIVADYFAMLADELAGVPFIKSAHSSALMAVIGRSHRSVEFKHQNISAVLEELGLPWIRGYRPKRNYQNAIIEAVDRFLSGNAKTLDLISEPHKEPIVDEGVLVQAPLISSRPQAANRRLHRLVRKFDPVERDHRNRRLGKAGEAFVLEFERKKLTEQNRQDLARRIRWTADEDGDGAGYDISSYTLAGRDLLIEVKTTNGSARTPFYLTRNEVEVANERREDWIIYRVHLFFESPRIFTVVPPLESSLVLRPEAWRASF